MTIKIIQFLANVIYAGILTSDMFGLQTTSGQPTEDLMRSRQAPSEKAASDSRRARRTRQDR